MLAITLIICGYLLGSVPSSYLAARWIKGINLREFGSGTLSGSMVWEHVARWAIVPVGVFDILKATFPAWLGLKLGLGEGIAVAAGVAAVIGHNWPIYLRFHGGRGLGSFMGLLLVIYPWGVPWMITFLTIGFLLGDSAPWAIASLLTLPVLTFWAGGSKTIIWAVGIMLLITAGKRLEANGRSLPPTGPNRRQVLLRRLFFDRDIPSHADWINRHP